MRKPRRDKGGVPLAVFVRMGGGKGVGGDVERVIRWRDPPGGVKRIRSRVGNEAGGYSKLI